MIIYSKSRSRLLLAGTGIATLAGAAKAAWKIDLVKTGRDVEILRRYFKPLMIGGGTMMMIPAAIAMTSAKSRKSLLSAFNRRSSALFGLSMAGMAGMGYLGKHMDNSAKSNWTEELLNTASQAALMAGLITGKN